MVFLSTLSLRRATSVILASLDGQIISIHALLAESDRGKDIYFHQYDISIHALLAESDRFRSASVLRLSISIHALLAESDADRLPPLTGAHNFYPRSPCGERPNARG